MLKNKQLFSIVWLLALFFGLYGQEVPKIQSAATVNVGVMIQAVADFQNERIVPGVNGFSLGNARLIAHGSLPGDFAYRLQANAVGSTTLQEARVMYWFKRDRLRVHAGVFKAPFSKEFLIRADAIDFVNRSNVVNALRPGFQTGVMLEFWPAAEELQLRVGAFNGNRPAANGNDNNAYLYVGRLTWLPVREESNNVEAGINFGFSDDNAARVDGLEFNGERELFGADIRYQGISWLFAAEYLRGSLLGPGDFSPQPSGFHVTGGYMLNPQNQLLLRYETYNNDRGSETNWVVLGYNLWPTAVTEFQANYVLDLDNTETDHHRVLLNVQVSFQ